MKARSRLGILAAMLVAAGVGFTAFKVYGGASVEECYACRRSIHAHSRTVALDNGRSRVFCCPACALSEHEQEGKPIRITELTAFLTGAKLSPRDAFAVKGSDVNMCAHTQELVNADKRAAVLRYDRCAPSILAFARQSEALQFAREHGGQVMPLREVVSALSR